MKLLLRQRRLPNSATGATMPAYALPALARQPSLRKTALACQTVAGEASEGWCAVRDFELVTVLILSQAPPTSWANRANGAASEDRTPVGSLPKSHSATEIKQHEWCRRGLLSTCNLRVTNALALPVAPRRRTPSQRRETGKLINHTLRAAKPLLSARFRRSSLF